MRCTVNGKLYKTYKEDIDCFPDGFRLIVYRQGISYELEYGYPEYIYGRSMGRQLCLFAYHRR